MTTGEVSLVDAGANLRTFLFAKSNGANMPTPNKPDTETTKDGGGEQTAKVMALPADARNQMIEGVHDALEKLTGVTQALKESTVDDGAEVPSELPRMIKEASDALSKIASAFMGEGDSSESDEGESGEGESDGSTEKARRFTPRRISELRSIVEAGQKLLAEVDAGDASAEGEGDDAGESGTEKSAITSQILDAVKFLTGQVETLVKDQKDAREEAAETKKSLDDAHEQITKLQSDLNSPGQARSQASEGEEVETEKTNGEVQWPADFSAHVVSKMRGHG